MIIQVNVEVPLILGEKEKKQPLTLPLKHEEKSLKFNESSNTETLQYINTNLPALGQIKMFKQPLTFNLFESISNDSSSHNEYVPSETSQGNDIKPVIVSNETTYSSSDEESPSSSKLKNI